MDIINNPRSRNCIVNINHKHIFGNCNQREILGLTAIIADNDGLLVIKDRSTLKCIVVEGESVKLGNYKQCTYFKMEDNSIKITDKHTYSL